jgi:hypothetical protein
MDGLLRKFVFGTPDVTVVWLLLILVAVAATFWIFSPGLRQRTRDAERLRMAGIQRRERLGQRAADDRRYATEVAVAAQRARDRELQLRAAWLAVQGKAETAWRAYDAAEAELLRVVPAGAIPLSPDDEERWEHELDRAATAACLRGELSPLDLSEALSRRGAWDGHRHPADQEIAIRRRIRTGCYAAYRTIATREHGAWDAYTTAAIQARSLHDEAFAALNRARQTDELLAVATADRRRTAVVGRERRRRGLIQA